MSLSPLHGVLRHQLKIGDEDFATKVGVHRTRIWAIRTGRMTPSAETALSILDALRKLGVELTLAELLTKPSRKPRRRASGSRAA